MMPFKYPEDASKAALIKCKITTFDLYEEKLTVKTYTVHPTNEKGKILHRGPDDYTLKDPVLAELVYRGCSDLFLGDELIAQCRGFRKFPGTEDNTDEDELPYENAEEKDFGTFTDMRAKDDAMVAEWNRNNQLKTTFQEKSNGKFAVFTLFNLKGRLCIFGGSKNVHVPRSLNVNLDSIRKNPKNLHYMILAAIIEDIRKYEHPERLVGKSFTGEYCDGKHIVYEPQSSSGELKPRMVYFDESLPECFAKPKHILPAVDGMPTEEMMKSLRKLRNIEGVVVCFINTHSGQIIRRKHKTVWYVIIRCWREIIRSYNKSVAVSTVISKLISRMHSRSDQFLHMDKDELDEWKDVAKTFMNRLYTSHFEYRDVDPQSEVGMAYIWHTLMSEGYVEKTLESQSSLSDATSQPTPEKKIPSAINPTDFTPEQPSCNNILMTPEYFYIIPYIYDPVLVIMQGPPGSGKSTVVKQLVAYIAHFNEFFKDTLGHVDKSVEVFSTDSYFTNETGEYKFDPTKLAEFHGKNLTAACESKADIVVIDNTNLAPYEYAKYKSQMLHRHVIVLACKADSCVDLLKRNVHGLKLQALERMCAKYKPAAPMYIGLFADKPFRERYANLVTQLQPLHITEKFVGGDMKKMTDVDVNDVRIPVVIKVTGVSTSEAGSALVVESVNNTLKTEATPHITIATNVGFKAVDVGKNIKTENTTAFPEPHHIVFMFRYPMF